MCICERPGVLSLLTHTIVSNVSLLVWMITTDASIYMVRIPGLFLFPQQSLDKIRVD